MGWKPHKLEGCWGLNNFFTRIGVTTKFSRGDTNVSGVHPGWTSDEGCKKQPEGEVTSFCKVSTDVPPQNGSECWP